MNQAPKDENHVSALLARSSDGSNATVKVCTEVATRTMSVMENGVASVELIPLVRDENHVPVMTAVSSVDGVTPVEIYADPVTRKLFIEKN